MKHARASIAVFAALACTGCGGGDDTEDRGAVVEEAPTPIETPDWYAACTSFAEYAQAGQPGDGSEPNDERWSAVRDVSGLLGDYPDEELQDARDGLVSALNTTEEEWSTAADTFAQACFDSGWDG